MKRNIIRIIGITLTLALLIGMSACGGAKDDVKDSGAPEGSAPAESTSVDKESYTISYASNDAPGVIRYDMLEMKFKELIEEKTGGRITVEMYPSGSLSKPGECLDAIKNGTVDVGQDSYTRYAGQYPYYDLFTSPGWKFNSFEDFNLAAAGFIKEFPDSSMVDFKPIVICDAGEFGLVSTKPIRSIADIKGKSIRNTPSFIPLFDKFKANSVDVSSGEMYEALRLNTIDATNTNNHAIPTFHLEEVCKSFTALPIEHADVGIFMSQKLYDSFDKELQAQVDEVCEEMKQVALDYIHATTDDAVNQIKAANPDFEFINFSDDEINTLAETAQSILKEKADALDKSGLKGTDAYKWLTDHQSK